MDCGTWPVIELDLMQMAMMMILLFALSLSNTIMTLRKLDFFRVSDRGILCLCIEAISLRLI